MVFFRGSSSIFWISSLIIVLSVLGEVYSQPPYTDFRIGVGIWDVTGPASETGMMGYANPSQSSHGLHLRQRARAFVVVDWYTGVRTVYMSLETCMIFQEVKTAALEIIANELGDDTLYTNQNVLISATHTHSGPGGFSYYPLYDITTLGFFPENFETISKGIANAILMAHHNLTVGGRILFSVGQLYQSNANRSPTAYMANPESERAEYPDGNTDKIITILRLQNEEGKDIGMINWFAVHGTSMNNTNDLISSDNKGFAAYLTDQYFNGNDSLPGMGPFVSAFGQSNEGDVTPNTRGAFCPDGTPCDAPHSTCNGKNELCQGLGPGATDFLSTEMIGTNQFKAALELWNNASYDLVGHVGYIHQFVDMQNVEVDLTYSGTGQNETTCLGALGDAFAAGTTDGPGAFNFQQGTNDSNPNGFWNIIAGFLSEPTPEQKKCQYPKPILFNTGGITFPCPWTASILPLQIVNWGQLYIIAVPGEFTTMSGRRLRNTVTSVLEANGVQNPIVVIAGLSNSYSHYITTTEEFQVQRYEGASTLYGPYTLNAYQQLYAGLTQSLLNNQTVDPGPNPPDYSNKTFTLRPPVIEDTLPYNVNFGDVYLNVFPSYVAGSIIQCTFWAADLRNDYQTQGTFLTVQQQQGDGSWETIRVDGDWETKLYWKRPSALDVTQSLVTVEWDSPVTAQPGTYRLQTFGVSKALGGQLTPFTGTSDTFTLTAPS